MGIQILGRLIHSSGEINVNRGFGVLAFPGRVGIWPEITSITLKDQSKYVKSVSLFFSAFFSNSTFLDSLES